VQPLASLTGMTPTAPSRRVGGTLGNRAWSRLTKRSNGGSNLGHDPEGPESLCLSRALGRLRLRQLRKFIFPSNSWPFPTGCGGPPATTDCCEHANATTDCDALTCAVRGFSQLVFRGSIPKDLRPKVAAMPKPERPRGWRGVKCRTALRSRITLGRLLANRRRFQCPSKESPSAHRLDTTTGHGSERVQALGDSLWSGQGKSAASGRLTV